MSRQPTAPAYQKSKTLDNKYLLGDEIGKGAYVSLENIAQEDLNIIMQEIDLLKMLNHKNIVKYLGSSKTKTHLHTILEYVENGSLANIIKPNKFGPFPESLVAVYIAQVLEGLVYLHDQGVIHRDIKGANILTTKEIVIYIGDGKVVHFTRRGQEIGTVTVLNLLLISSGPARPREPCQTCTRPQQVHGVICSCLNCFLAGGVLYRFEYVVCPSLFLAKAHSGTCTLAVSDPNETVVHPAKYLLENGFGCYNVFKNNYEDFAIYCKTRLLVVDQGRIGQSGQAISIIGGPLAAILSTLLCLVTTNVYGMAATAVGVYCASRYAADIGMRKDVVKVQVEDLTRRLATGMLQVVSSQTLVTLAYEPFALVS